MATDAFFSILSLPSGLVNKFCRKLLKIRNFSSEPFGSLIEEETEKKVLEDGVILKLEEHDDAVYGCEWSQANPWLFASLSHDGRIVINQVPKAVKYDILL